MLRGGPRPSLNTHEAASLEAESVLHPAAPAPGAILREVSTPGPSSTRSARFCACGYNLPINRRRRCGGCGWTYATEDLGKLRHA